jgi:hypothetical protein
VTIFSGLEPKTLTIMLIIALIGIPSCSPHTGHY